MIIMEPAFDHCFGLTEIVFFTSLAMFCEQVFGNGVFQVGIYRFLLLDHALSEHLAGRVAGAIL